MSKYRRLASLFILAELLLLLVMNIVLTKQLRQAEDFYKVDAARAGLELSSGKSMEKIDLKAYPSLKEIRHFLPAEEKYYKYPYVVKDIDGQLYAFLYEKESNKPIFIRINAFAAILLLIQLCLILYIDRKLISPFSRMNSLTVELARGNLSLPVKQEKSKYFGRFIWGMDMLRETLEDNKKRELSLLKEKKTMILSLSHDIKTPLSAIDLYNKALQKGLYTTDEEKAAAYKGIDKNISEIKAYVSQIAEASREDFLSLNVNMGEIYLSKVMDTVKNYYSEKMAGLHTAFSVGAIEDCLLRADFDRLVEVMQNILENAIKYGDGKSVTIDFDEEEDCRLIIVKNTGCSLKSEELPNIFDSFYRGSNSERLEGSGLGLYICKQLMRKMDGDIFAHIKENCFFVTVVIRKV